MKNAVIVIAKKEGALVKDQLLMLFVEGQAKAVLEDYEEEKGAPQEFSELSDRLKAVLYTTATREAKMLMFETRVQQLQKRKDEIMISLVKLYTAAQVFNTAVKRKFLQGISPVLKKMKVVNIAKAKTKLQFKLPQTLISRGFTRRTVLHAPAFQQKGINHLFVFCNKAYDPATCHKLLQHCREAKAHLAPTPESDPASTDKVFCMDNNKRLHNTNEKLQQKGITVRNKSITHTKTEATLIITTDYLNPPS